MTRKEILERSKDRICEDRNYSYGEPENNFEKIATMWTAYKSETFTAKDVAVMMILLKVARISATYDLDTFIDIAGYAACGGEIVTAGKLREDE